MASDSTSLGGITVTALQGSIVALLYSVQCTLYTVQCALCTVHCTLYTVRCTLYTVHCTLYTVHWKLHTVQYTNWKLYNCIWYNVQHTLLFYTRVSILCLLHIYAVHVGQVLKLAEKFCSRIMQTKGFSSGAYSCALGYVCLYVSIEGQFSTVQYSTVLYCTAVLKNARLDVFRFFITYNF